MPLSGSIIIGEVTPQVECGAFPAKRALGDTISVSADIFTHGTDMLGAELLFRKKGEDDWRRSAMRQGQDDRWQCEFRAEEIGAYQFTIEAWVDRYSTWLGNLKKWQLAGEDTAQDLKIGMAMLGEIASSSGSEGKAIAEIVARMQKAGQSHATEIASDARTVELATRNQKRDCTRFGKELEIVVESRLARFANWYELFPRSQSKVEGRHGNFEDCIQRLDDISAMGFNILYLAPIHPIGTTNRRGRNGSPVALETDPGSPWAIGSSDGGHKSINRELGTLADFKQLLRKARQKRMEVALDIAFQCSPDHPYVRDHPDWFHHRSDGSIRYAENPPKKYFDIYPLNFETGDREGLWNELKSIFDFWIEAGVTIFRVDNPHTKPFAFWEWVIGEIKKEHPEVIFLSEAFTRPKVMYELSKLGFTESYSYFTWKNFNWELEEYFAEVNMSGTADFFWPNLFTNTPDILPFVLQKGGVPAFMLRALLAATLSPLWGIYSGFELCENEALPGKEEYLNSEKYEIRQRDWNRPGNIRKLITRLNEIRRDHESLQELGNLEFHPAPNPNLLLYTKKSVDGDDVLMIVVNLNPYEAQDAVLRVPIDRLGVRADESYGVRDLLTGELFRWYGEYNYVRLVPGERPGHVFAIERFSA